MLSAADQLTPQLERLASLFTGGALTDEEFAMAKGSVIEVCKQLAKRAYPRPWGMPAPRPLHGALRKVSDPSRGAYRFVLVAPSIVARPLPFPLVVFFRLFALAPGFALRPTTTDVNDRGCVVADRD